MSNVFAAGPIRLLSHSWEQNQKRNPFSFPNSNLDDSSFEQFLFYSIHIRTTSVHTVRWRRIEFFVCGGGEGGRGRRKTKKKMDNKKKIHCCETPNSEKLKNQSTRSLPFIKSYFYLSKFNFTFDNFCCSRDFRFVGKIQKFVTYFLTIDCFQLCFTIHHLILKYINFPFIWTPFFPIPIYLRQSHNEHTNTITKNSMWMNSRKLTTAISVCLKCPQA